MEELQQVQVALEVSKRRHIFVAERRVAPLDDAPQVFGGYLGRGDVERQDVEGELGERKVLPALPI